MSNKSGVKIGGVSAEIAFVMVDIADVFRSRGAEFVVTSVMDGKHMDGSKHYTGHAVDLRVRSLPAALRVEIADDLRRRLGAEFYVVIEPDHIHVEFDPKV